VARLPLFEKPGDYEAFEQLIEEAYDREGLPIFSYCVMPNHWHFVVRPKTKHQVTRFFRWLTNTHDALARSSPYREHGPSLSGAIQGISD
jgi:putative transposase